MKRRIRVGLIVVSTWSIIFAVVAAAASVCSSCGAAVPTRISRTPVR